MTKFEVLVSREAGIYTKYFTVEADNEDDASTKAEQLAKDVPIKKWDYNESGSYDEPIYQVEEINKIE